MTFAGSPGLTSHKPIFKEAEVSETKTETRITQVSTVIVPVSDQDRALAFFTEKLGFETRVDVPFGDGNRWVEVAPAGGTTTVSLALPPEGAPAKMEGGCVSFETEDIDADHAELRAKGVDVDDEVSRYGDPVPPMFWFSDPDGNRYLIVQRA
jgi:catechol 2,3-dioxygenase-like lactoylglutathione lyase family enzyme